VEATEEDLGESITAGSRVLGSIIGSRHHDRSSVFG
jgi:hypothetical protein